jgi:predicted ArsR family transcriptional regulator
MVADAAANTTAVDVDESQHWTPPFSENSTHSLTHSIYTVNINMIKHCAMFLVAEMARPMVTSETQRQAAETAMNAIADAPNTTQRSLMRILLRNKEGLTVQALAQSLAISRNAVRQHLTSLERDGLVAKGVTHRSGGRPEQLYVLTNDGNERFPRQYSWFSELLLQTLQAQPDGIGLKDKLAEMGRSVAATLKARLVDESGSSGRIAAIAEIMQELGYDATAKTGNGDRSIEARNCVFHKLAAKHPEVCSFDLGLLSASSGCRVEHGSCMVRGGDACRFHFVPEHREAAAK